MFTETDFDHHFPFDIARKNQLEICTQIAKGFETKKYVVLQAPTGVGKSAVAYAISGYFKELHDWTSYVLTSQKGLQEQYMKSFREFNKAKLSIATVKGAENYPCDLAKGRSCKVGACKFDKKITCHCAYNVLKDEVYGSDLGVLNYSYYMAMAGILKTGKIPEKALKFDYRPFLILDEAHNTEGVLLNLGAFKIKPIEIKTLYKYHCEPIPKFDDKEKLFVWLEEEILPWSQDILDKILLKIATMDKEELKGMSLLNKQLSFFDNLTGQIQGCLALRENDNEVVINKDEWQIEFKPLAVDNDLRDLLFANSEKVLMMSATILDIDQFCKDLNIDIRDVEYVVCDDFFPKENRPILDLSSKIGKINYNTMEKVRPKIVKIVTNILKKHAGQRGIIHTQSYALAKYIIENVPEEYAKRLMIPRGGNRDQDIDKFHRNHSDGVLLSPSLTEGLDLHGDLGEFSVICKAPFGFLGDNFVKTRMELNSRWYAVETIRKIIQAYGRTLRSETDKSVTYILDPAISNLLTRNHRIVPPWFFEAYKEL